MKILDEVQMLERMFELIRKKKSGDSSSFHKKLGISRGKLYNLLDELRDIGIHIRYNKRLRSFCIDDKIKVIVRKPIQIIKEDELKETGGGIKKYPSVHFFGQVSA